MSEKQENAHARHRRCPHCGGCVDHLCRETITEPATQRQLAEVTAERDALLAEASPLRAPEREDLQRAHRLLMVLRSGEDLLKKLDAAEAERDALKRRVAELQRLVDNATAGPGDHI